MVTYRVIFKKAIPFLLILVASLVGIKSGEIYGEWQRDKSRTEMTSQIVSSMKSIRVGDQLPAHTFEDLNGKSVSSIVLGQAKTLIMYVTPTCDGCVWQLRALASIDRSSHGDITVVVITSANPRLMEDLIDELELDWPVLYDHRGEFAQIVNINDFPFNILVSSSSEILDLSAGELQADEILEFFE